jgi:hypothetical protein
LVSQSGNVFFTDVFLDDVEMGRLLSDSLDVWNLVARNDEEVCGLGADLRIVTGAHFQHLEALAVATFTSDLEDRELIWHQFFNPLVHFAEESLVSGDPILAGQGAHSFSTSS